MQGGHLKPLIDENTYYEQDIFKFFAAELVLAINYLHSKSIVHHDLKLDTVVLDRKSHLKLTDFVLLSINKKMYELGLIKSSIEEKVPMDNYICDKHSSIISPLNRLRGDSKSAKIQKAYRMPSLVLKRERTQFDSWKGCDVENRDSRKGVIHIVRAPDYIVPEVLDGKFQEGIALESDWWILSIMIYEMPPEYRHSMTKVNS